MKSAVYVAIVHFGNAFKCDFFEILEVYSFGDLAQR